MLPVPSIEYIPKIYKDASEDSMVSLTNKMDENIEAWRDEAIQIERYLDPARAPNQFIEIFGEMMNAGLLDLDSERIKRRKIASAVKVHKNRGTWQFDVKSVIDAIAGGDSSLFSTQYSAFWVLSDGTDAVYSSWGAFGFESDQGFDGIILAGNGEESIYPGNIRIDVDNSSLTADEVEHLKLGLEDSVPAYMRVILGYVSGGQFIEYGRMG